MNVHDENKTQFKLFCVGTYNIEEILLEEAREFESWPYLKETLWLLVDGTLNCDHGNTDSRASYATPGRYF